MMSKLLYLGLGDLHLYLYGLVGGGAVSISASLAGGCGDRRGWLRDLCSRRAGGRVSRDEGIGRCVHRDWAGGRRRRHQAGRAGRAGWRWGGGNILHPGRILVLGAACHASAWLGVIGTRPPAAAASAASAASALLERAIFFAEILLGVSLRRRLVLGWACGWCGGCGGCGKGGWSRCCCCSVGVARWAGGRFSACQPPCRVR